MGQKEDYGTKLNPPVCNDPQWRLSWPGDESEWFVLRQDMTPWENALHSEIVTNIEKRRQAKNKERG